MAGIPMNDIINTILDKKFKRVGLDGYADSEVDNFLDEICDVVEELQNNMERLRQQLNETQTAKESLESKLQLAREEATSLRAAQTSQPVKTVYAPAPAPTSAAGAAEVLEMAQKMKSDLLAKAQQDADQMLAQARREVEEQMGDLNAKRDALEAQVNQLRGIAADYRDKLNALLDLTKEAVDSADL